MKKTYIQPIVEFTEMQNENPLAISHNDAVGVGTGEKNGGLTNNRRGTWGDLWYEGEE